MCGRDARAGARSLLTSGDDGKPVCSAGRVGTREFFCVFVVLAVTANGRRTLGTHKSMTEPERDPQEGQSPGRGRCGVESHCTLE